MAHVKGTNNSETINLFDGVTFGDDVIWGYGGNDSILASPTMIIFSAAPGLMRSTGDRAPIRRATTLDRRHHGELELGVGVGGDAEGDTYFGIENLKAEITRTRSSATTATTGLGEVSATTSSTAGTAMTYCMPVQATTPSRAAAVPTGSAASRGSTRPLTMSCPRA